MRVFLIISFLLTCLLAADENTAVRRLCAYLKIKDIAHGLKEAEVSLAEYPQSAALQEGYIRLLASGGFEIEALHAWKKYEYHFKKSEERRELLEAIAWGSIRKGSRSSLLLARLLSLVGATVTNDAYAVDILKAGLKDSNWQIRKMSVLFAAYLMDAALEREIVRLLQDDPAFEVRIQAVKATAEMHIAEAAPILKRILYSKDLSAEERAIIVAALAEVTEHVSIQEIERLAKSDRAALRLLASSLVCKQGKEALVGPLIPLLEDSNPEVRVGVLNAIGILRIQEWEGTPILELIQPNLQERNFEVAITAAWLATLHDPSYATTFHPWLQSKHEEIRRFAAGALGFTGSYGADEAVKVMKKHSDPFVRLNLAVALIGQRKEVKAACEELAFFLRSNSSLLMEKPTCNPLVEIIAPIERDENQILSKEAQDQMVRLQLLRLLAILEYPKTMEALKKFLKEKTFGITGLAATMLIEEGSAEELQLIRQLLHDADPKIKTQAALVLGMWAKDDKEALRVLHEAYPKADRELKIKILESCGRMGNPESVPFLLAAMEDPFQVIRIVSAASLILCLNH